MAKQYLSARVQQDFPVHAARVTLCDNVKTVRLITKDDRFQTSGAR